MRSRLPAAASIFCARRQLGHVPSALRHVAQMGFPQSVHGATDGTLLWKKQSMAYLVSISFTFPTYRAAPQEVSPR